MCKWIKASERLPKRNAEYFVIADGIKNVGIFSDGDFWANDKRLNVSQWLDESAESDSREQVRKLREGLEALIVPQHFIVNFPDKESQSRYNESVRNAKQLLTETEG